MTKFDLTDTPEQTAFELVPPGEYHVRVVGAKPYAAQSGNEGTNLDLSIVDGEQAGRRVFDTLWHSAASLPRMRAAAEAFGCPLKGFDPLVDLTGREAIAVVRHETYNERTREKVKAYSALPAEARDPLGGGYTPKSHAPQGEGSDIPFAPSMV